jgi:nicotinate-nucleotide--dimethylbenzimidazole phosphoribosyltransferase
MPEPQPAAPATTAPGSDAVPAPGRLLTATVQTIQPLDAEAMAQAQARQSRLTKPPGSLGRLEALSVHLAGITGQVCPRLGRKVAFVLAADHGVVRQGVSAYPQEVTAQMVRNFLQGGAAINVLARTVGADVVVADFGVAAILPAHAALRSCRIAPGTQDMSSGPAMTPAQALAAIEAGIGLFHQEHQARRIGLVALGEMGIGNSTSAAAIAAAITGRAAAEVTGPGTGLDAAGVAHKIAVIERALAVNRPDPAKPLDVLAKVGGFEIGGLAGVLLAAAAARVPVLLDGFISTAAALLACGLAPMAREYLIAAHRSAEPGHAVALEHLRLRPLLDLDMRLGEGSGAALAMPLVEAAARLLTEMATFEEAGVSERRG